MNDPVPIDPVPIDPVPRHVEQAAHALGLDATTARTITALEGAGVVTVLLKGPAIAHWLYRDDSSGLRAYLDVDLLVSPPTFAAAERVVEGLGYRNQRDGVRASESGWNQESSWERGGSPPTIIDLHRGFHGADDWTEWWAQVSEHSVRITVAGRSVRVPDEAGCALVVALHDTAVNRSARSGEDLRRAIDRFDDAVWVEAARRAAACAALPSLELGLSRHEAGPALARRIGLSSPLPPEVAVRQLSRGSDAHRVGRAQRLTQGLRGAVGWRERARLLADILFPSNNLLRATWPLARRGPLGLALVRLWHPIVTVARAPGVLVLALRGRRRARASGWTREAPRR